MKTILVFFIVAILGASTPLQAARPIPSYKAPISHMANFQEKDHNRDGTLDPKGKRNMIVVSNVIGPAKLPITFWVYSLDGLDILGPLSIMDDEQISVPIDDRLWGVFFETDEKAVVSVWIEPDVVE